MGPLSTEAISLEARRDLELEGCAVEWNREGILSNLTRLDHDFQAENAKQKVSFIGKEELYRKEENNTLKTGLGKNMESLHY